MRKNVRAGSHQSTQRIWKCSSGDSASFRDRQFEPRPELGHGTNSLCIVGGVALSKDCFRSSCIFLPVRSILPIPKEIFDRDYETGRPVCGEYLNIISRIDNYRLVLAQNFRTSYFAHWVTNSSDGDLRPVRFRWLKFMIRFDRYHRWTFPWCGSVWYNPFPKCMSGSSTNGYISCADHARTFTISAKVHEYRVNHQFLQCRFQHSLSVREMNGTHNDATKKIYPFTWFRQFVTVFVHFSLIPLAGFRSACLFPARKNISTLALATGTRPFHHWLVVPGSRMVKLLKL